MPGGRGRTKWPRKEIASMPLQGRARSGACRQAQVALYCALYPTHQVQYKHGEECASHQPLEWVLGSGTLLGGWCSCPELIVVEQLVECAFCRAGSEIWG